jgi:hypothetical protein
MVSLNALAAGSEAAAGAREKSSINTVKKNKCTLLPTQEINVTYAVAFLGNFINLIILLNQPIKDSCL